MSIKIRVESAGSTQIYRTTATTIGQLFADGDFREDFNQGDRAQPMVNGENAESTYVLQTDDLVSSYVGASSKSL